MKEPSRWRNSHHQGKGLDCSARLRSLVDQARKLKHGHYDNQDLTQGAITFFIMGYFSYGNNFVVASSVTTERVNARARGTRRWLDSKRCKRKSRPLFFDLTRIGRLMISRE